MSLFICRFCQIEKQSIKSLTAHETFCKNNPDRKIQNTEAARQKANSKTPCVYCNTQYSNANMKKHEQSCRKNPNNVSLCLNCNTPTSRGKYCSTKCGISYSNKNKIRSKETNEKISKSLSGKKHNHGNGQKFCKIQALYCEICKSPFVLKSWSKTRKTCSEKCRIELVFTDRKYVNGKRKTIEYFCKYENKNVFLESSWELEIAKFLDENNINWIRPKSLTWIDDNSKRRRYFPDFYLIDYNIYLDPKNSYCMKLDEDKMNYFSKRMNIIYGHKDLIKEKVLLVNKSIDKHPEIV